MIGSVIVIFFTQKYIEIFFLKKKIIFDISTSKWFENTKNILIWNKKKFKIFFKSIFTEILFYYLFSVFFSLITPWKYTIVVIFVSVCKPLDKKKKKKPHMLILEFKMLVIDECFGFYWNNKIT
jgi:hypothetical protein